MIFRRFAAFAALVLSAFLLDGCTCCAYLNHMFNAERLSEEATEMREARLDSVADELSSMPGTEERHKYDKIIEKGSRVLERFPKNEKRTAEAVFLIGESFRHEHEWAKAILKYDEYERYFADYDSMRAVEYQRAYCLYQTHEYNLSRFALEPVVASKNHPYYFQGLNLMSLLDEQSEFPDQAIDALEAILADTVGTPYMRGKAHFRLAGLYFAKENWAKAREHYKAKEIAELNVREKETADVNAAECLVNMGEFLQAADEYKAICRNEEYEKKLGEYLVRLGEIMVLAKRYPDAIIVFQKVNNDYKWTNHAARSYFNLGDYEQTVTMDYERAMVYYDSSFISRTASEWGRKSRERRDALKRLIALRQANDDDLKKDSIPNAKNFFSSEFQIAELFLFKLSEVDSALKRLNTVIEGEPDSLKVMRATYARAFIYDEFKHDPDSAEALYKEIIEKYPNTDYAKQAQANLGMRVTMQTEDDKSKERYLHAESLWTQASEVPLNQFERVDSAYLAAVAAFDSIYQEYPKTDAGVQALYMKAVYFTMTPDRKDSAVVIYRKLSSDYGNTPWGKEASKILNRRVTLSDDDINRLRRRVQQSLDHIDNLSKRYYENLNKPPEEKKVEVKTQEDEVLENTYNSMYDFE